MTIQLNPISVFVMIYSVNANKDSNVVIEHKGGHCNNVIEATIMIISIRLESDHCLSLSLTKLGGADAEKFLWWRFGN